MASVGHIVVGMAASRLNDERPALQWTSALFWASLSMFPDADVIGIPFGIGFGSPWGHRGATHSFAFAAAVGIVIGAGAYWLGRPPLKTGLLAAAVLASHGLLDTLTNGGMGCALFWPFDLTRYFAPWRPIPVSPIGLAYLSPNGLFVAVTEILIFAPVLVFALWPRRRRDTRSRG